MRIDKNENQPIESRYAEAAVRSAARIALMSVAPARETADESTEREVTFKARDGWQIKGFLHVPASGGKAPGVVLVHASKHESDAYGNISTAGLPQTLSRQKIATLRIDVRGRGASRGLREFHSMPPHERDAVRLDVRAAIDFLVSQSKVDRNRIGIIAEQDNANAASIAGARDHRVAAFILISGRLSDSAKDAIARSDAPIFCLVSKEDRRGFKDMTDVYLASKSEHSRLKVFEGLALGTTMFSTWRFEFPHEQPIDEIAGIWLAERLKGGSSGNARKRRGDKVSSASKKR